MWGYFHIAADRKTGKSQLRAGKMPTLRKNRAPFTGHFSSFALLSSRGVVDTLAAGRLYWFSLYEPKTMHGRSRRDGRRRDRDD